MAADGAVRHAGSSRCPKRKEIASCLNPYSDEWPVRQIVALSVCEISERDSFMVKCRILEKMVDFFPLLRYDKQSINIHKLR